MLFVSPCENTSVLTGANVVERAIDSICGHLQSSKKVVMFVGDRDVFEHISTQRNLNRSIFVHADDADTKGRYSLIVLHSQMSNYNNGIYSIELEAETVNKLHSMHVQLVSKFLAVI